MIGRRGSRPASIEENSGSVGRTFPLERDKKKNSQKNGELPERERVRITHLGFQSRVSVGEGKRDKFEQ